jgi:hypothetical protein
MPKILATFAVLTMTAFFSLPSPANAASKSQAGAETDQSATMTTDISSRRRRHRHHVYYGWIRDRGPQVSYYWGLPVSYAYGGPAGFYSSWDPYPYYYSYNAGYRSYPYRDWYWGPRLFPYGPWW